MQKIVDTVIKLYYLKNFRPDLYLYFLSYHQLVSVDCLFYYLNHYYFVKNSSNLKLQFSLIFNLSKCHFMNSNIMWIIQYYPIGFNLLVFEGLFLEFDLLCYFLFVTFYHLMLSIFGCSNRLV